MKLFLLSVFLFWIISTIGILLYELYQEKQEKKRKEIKEKFFQWVIKELKKNPLDKEYY